MGACIISKHTVERDSGIIMFFSNKNISIKNK